MLFGLYFVVTFGCFEVVFVELLFGFVNLHLCGFRVEVGFVCIDVLAVACDVVLRLLAGLIAG